MAKIHKDILKLLEEKPSTLVEIAEKLEKSEKKVYNALKKLFSDGKIESNSKTRQYSLAKE
jgi:predicted transcriptional regulator